MSGVSCFTVSAVYMYIIVYYQYGLQSNDSNHTTCAQTPICIECYIFVTYYFARINYHYYYVKNVKNETTEM